MVSEAMCRRIRVWIPDGNVVTKPGRGLCEHGAQLPSAKHPEHGSRRNQ
jgi:hypothetical protein